MLYTIWWMYMRRQYLQLYSGSAYSRYALAKKTGSAGILLPSNVIFLVSISSHLINRTGNFVTPYRGTWLHLRSYVEEAFRLGLDNYKSFFPILAPTRRLGGTERPPLFDSRETLLLLFQVTLRQKVWHRKGQFGMLLTVDHSVVVID